MEGESRRKSRGLYSSTSDSMGDGERMVFNTEVTEFRLTEAPEKRGEAGVVGKLVPKWKEGEGGRASVARKGLSRFLQGSRNRAAGDWCCRAARSARDANGAHD